MGRFFFDTFDGREITRDPVGIECHTPKEVSDLAIGALPDIARDELPDGGDHIFWVKVRDESGVEVFEASLVLASQWVGGAKSFGSGDR